MFNKLYVKVKDKIKQNYKFILLLILFYIICTFPLPYYIESPGGILDVSSRVEVENSYKVNGSFNLAYVSEMKATLPTLLFALFNKDSDILKKEEVIINETEEEIEYRNHLLLEEANDNATIIGFMKANKYYMVTNRIVNVIYVHQQADTDLKIGDQIIMFNNEIVESKSHLLDLIEKTDDKIEFKVLNNNKEYIRYANKKDIEGKNVIGIVTAETKDVDTDFEVKFKFEKSESGPSGGFMMALSIYNYLTEKDITNGLKIVGTGTIDENGNVGSIGGVEYKIKAAVKKKADLFFIPIDNYEEALKVKEENNLNIKLISIENIEQAIDYLNNL